MESGSPQGDSTPTDSTLNLLGPDKKHRPIEIPYYLWNKLKTAAIGAAGRGSQINPDNDPDSADALALLAEVNRVQEMYIPPVGYDKDLWEHLDQEIKKKILKNISTYKPPSNVVRFFSRPDGNSGNAR